VTNLYEDKHGHIWIGTGGGISRYDGTTFKNFTTEDGLCDNDVNAIIEDKTGRFWIGTRGLACFYDPISSTFADMITPDGKFFGNVRHIIEDTYGHIWLGGRDGLWQYDFDSYTNHSQTFTGYIYGDKEGNIWTSSGSLGSSLWQLSVYQNVLPLSAAYHPSEVIKEYGMLFGIAIDRADHIWYGTLKGVYRYDGASITFFKNSK